jgi:hypothetical protein
MWYILISVLVLTDSITCYESEKVDAMISETVQSVLPHDIYPGFEIMHFEIDSSHLSYRLIENRFSKYFTVLDNGILMTTSNLSPLVNRRVDLIVLEQLSNHTETHEIHLYVINRRRMLTFSHENLGDGRITENVSLGTPIEGLPMLHARGNFPVHYIILPDNSGQQPFALIESHLGQTGFNLTLQSPKQMIRLVTAQRLDREKQASHRVVIQASDGDYISSSKIEGLIHVLDVNDNSPVFEQAIYTFDVLPTNLDELSIWNHIQPRWKRFSSIGQVLAKDDDGDQVSYKLLTPTNLVIIVPQTGEMLLTGEPEIASDINIERNFLVEAHDLRIPSKSGMSPARVRVRFLTCTSKKSSVELQGDNEIHRITKRRVTRAVRPTKKIEFTEADGNVEDKVAFNLEKENERETYKIRDTNKWVTVMSNGTVKVKQKWDYEELGPEKTIDFWVTITNSGN